MINIEQATGKGAAKSQGVHLTLKTDQEQLQVLLGPARFVDKQPLKIKPQDAVTVRGSRITFAGQPAIVAAEVKKGDQVLKLRDDTGTPVWRGQGRRKQ